MSKDITDDILLKVGMYKVNGAIEYTTQVNKLRRTIQILKYGDIPGRNYSCGVFNELGHLIGFAYIQTIDHFNKLMGLMDISFRLKEEQK